MAKKFQIIGNFPSGGGADYTLPIADEDTLGGVKVKIGSGIQVDEDGCISMDLKNSPVEFATEEDICSLFVVTTSH